MLIGQKRAYNSSSFLLYYSKIEQKPLESSKKRPKKTVNRSRNIAILASKKNFKTAVLRNKVRRSVKNAINKVILEISDTKKVGVREIKIQIKSYNLIFSLKKGFEKIVFEDLVEEIKQSLVKNAII